MRKSVAALCVGAAIALCAVGAVAAVNANGPTSEQLAADIAEVDAQIAEARAGLSLYGTGSVLHTQTLLQVQLLQNTRAMLDQKRRSWLRGISLDYVVQGQRLEPAAPDVVAGIEAEIADLRRTLDEAKLRSTQYGGLVGSLALVELQTTRVTLAAAEQRLFVAKYGSALPILDGAQAAQAAPKPKDPVGKTVNDKDAL